MPFACSYAGWLFCQEVHQLAGLGMHVARCGHRVCAASPLRTPAAARYNQLLNPPSCCALIVCCLQNLSKDPEARRWYVQAELVHCRTAMVGAAGILIPAVSSSSSCRSRRGQGRLGTGVVLWEQQLATAAKT